MKPNRLAPLAEQTGVVLLALLGYGEARGEGPLGILAVMHVALNRASRPNRTLEGVILAPQQFSCFNANDPNREHLLMADKDAPLAWGACAAIADLALGGHTSDPTGGASHYYADTIAPPGWTVGWRETARLGRHIFGVAT